MLLLISPAKKLDFESKLATKRATQPVMLDQAEILIGELRTRSPKQLSKLMSISDALGELNYERYRNWSRPFTKSNARPALLAFNGDVYGGIHAQDFSSDDFTFAQKHLRILSGLYGVLRPLDLMQPYRLEMGTKLRGKHGADLYQYWGEQLTELLAAQLKASRSKLVVNLASQEYFRSVKPKLLDAEIVAPQFLDWSNGKYRVLSYYAKRARGLMARYVIQNQILDVEQLKSFELEGYAFSQDASTDSKWVFQRRLAAGAGTG